MSEYFDVIVVGAGLSGISAGCHLKDRCPSKRFVILEGREAMGGTWDLFRYPGVRSDSDMYTLGYSFRPWTDPQAIADGPSILRYINETAADYGIDEHIRYQHRVEHAAWSSPDQRWTVTVKQADSDAPVTFTCSFLYMCSGYFNYEQGYLPEFPGIESFDGQVIHPQHWPEDLEYQGKRIVVIGSGATAVTLVPELAKQAAHVTMLQRSPTYMASRPYEDGLANSLRRWLPEKVVYKLTRTKNVVMGMAVFNLCRRFPEKAKALFIGGVKQELGDDELVAKNFTPRYYPWDQRLCLVPNADLFKAMEAGDVSVVTDNIETMTASGIRLTSGDSLEADIIVTATGLNMQLFGGMGLKVDNRTVTLNQCLMYKGMMVSGVPNFALAIGYTNASWTLKCDLTSTHICRLINYLDDKGLQSCRPIRPDAIAEEPLLDFSSGWVQRSLAQLPRQGARAPWKLYQNYARDLVMLGYGSVADEALEFQ